MSPFGFFSKGNRVVEEPAELRGRASTRQSRASLFAEKKCPLKEPGSSKKRNQEDSPRDFPRRRTPLLEDDVRVGAYASTLRASFPRGEKRGHPSSSGIDRGRLELFFGREWRGAPDRAFLGEITSSSVRIVRDPGRRDERRLLVI
ncbi:hypothetical protein KM043_007471 [Ampulex compressa]|nr:hypothetical protein KM043_007471 [Ampulex compressa]